MRGRRRKCYRPINRNLRRGNGSGSPSIQTVSGGLWESEDNYKTFVAGLYCAPIKGDGGSDLSEYSHR